MQKKDKIFNNPLEQIVDFKFDENVANVFPDMLKRSVPGYTYIIRIIGMLAKKYHKTGKNLYDLGCSLGASALSMRRSIDDPTAKIIAIDNSKAMTDKFSELVKYDTSEIPLEIITDDIQNIKIENASVVVLNFTLQFIPKEDRESIIQNIYNGLIPGGILILSEKIKFENFEENERLINLYHSFKSLNGYSDLEIAQKRTALENVLIPETKEVHYNRLKNVGFNSIDFWFQCFNFCSILAVK